MNQLFSNPALPYGLLAASMVIGGCLFCRQWVFSGKSSHGILGVALIFGALFVASLAPAGGAL